MNLWLMEYLFIVACLFLIGSVIGSLLNVCIYRLPREERFWPALKSLVSPPSHCPRCERRIPWYDNVPIAGWLFLRGRCRNCRSRISIRYPLIELLTGLLFVLVYCCEIPDWWAGPQASSLFHEYGPTGTPGAAWMTPFAMMHWRYALHIALVIALIVATFIDFDLKIIPDTVTLPAMAIGLIGNTLLGHVYIVPLWYQTPTMLGGVPIELRRMVDWPPGSTSLPGWFDAWTSFAGVPAWMTAHPHLHGFLVSMAGILVGGGIIWGVRIAGAWGLKREAMGFGDVVLVAMIGSFIGWQGTLAVFCIAPMCALAAVLCGAVFRFDREIPYGPYLSLAALIVLLAWRWISPQVDAVVMFGPLLPVVGMILLASLCGMLFAWRAILRRLGYEYEEPEPELIAEWTSGDQLAHFANEKIDERQGQWPQASWPGALTGRGLGYLYDWRGPG